MNLSNRYNVRLCDSDLQLLLGKIAFRKEVMHKRSFVQRTQGRRPVATPKPCYLDASGRPQTRVGGPLSSPESRLTPALYRNERGVLYERTREASLQRPSATQRSGRPCWRSRWSGLACSHLAVSGHARNRRPLRCGRRVDGATRMAFPSAACRVVQQRSTATELAISIRFRLKLVKMSRICPNLGY